MAEMMKIMEKNNRRVIKEKERRIAKEKEIMERMEEMKNINQEKEKFFLKKIIIQEGIINELAKRNQERSKKIRKMESTIEEERKKSKSELKKIEQKIDKVKNERDAKKVEKALKGKRINSFPETIKELRGLLNLDLSWKKNVTSLPESIGECKKLQILRLENTKMTSLPESIGKCK